MLDRMLSLPDLYETRSQRIPSLVEINLFPVRCQNTLRILEC